jgi:hypothetical protein
MTKQCGKWTYERCKNEALNFSHRADFIKQSRGGTINIYRKRNHLYINTYWQMELPRHIKF